MSWLNNHLETFVKPVLGYIPNPNTFDKGFYHFLTPPEMTRIKNAWRSIKKQACGQKVLLPGRDVWVFEVLARRENYPTKFIPQLSRLASSLISLEDIDDYFVVDTGFAGSIPIGLGATNFILLSHVLGNKEGTKQVFPNMKGSRSLALAVERTPKYWKSGYARKGEYQRSYDSLDTVYYGEGFVGQELSGINEFAASAVFTQMIYKDSSPKFEEVNLIGKLGPTNLTPISSQQPNTDLTSLFS